MIWVNECEWYFSLENLGVVWSDITMSPRNSHPSTVTSASRTLGGKPWRHKRCIWALKPSPDTRKGKGNQAINPKGVLWIKYWIARTMTRLENNQTSLWDTDTLVVKELEHSSIFINLSLFCHCSCFSFVDHHCTPLNDNFWGSRPGTKLGRSWNQISVCSCSRRSRRCSRWRRCCSWQGWRPSQWWGYDVRYDEVEYQRAENLRTTISQSVLRHLGTKIWTSFCSWSSLAWFARFWGCGGNHTAP